MYSFFIKSYNPKRIILLFSLFLVNYVLGQDKIDSAMTKLSEQYPQEKVYLAYDRADYVIGETIWFKGFVFSGYTLSDISTNLYIEMYNANKEIVAKKILPLFNGAAEGNFSIPDTTREGVYYIRAYTNWMLNFNEAFQYLQPILIYNPSSKLKLQKLDLPWTASVFAEGGNILQDKQTNVSVRLNSDGDMPQNWHGYLTDSLNPSEKLVSFQSIDPNVAQFNFIPSVGKEYKVIIEDDKGHTATVALPKVLSIGVNLNVNQNDSLLEYQVDFLNIPAQETYKLVGTIDNNIVYKAKIKNEGSTVVHSFATTQMPKGVLRLTLFDKDYQVASERLCFLYPDLQPKVIIDSLVINNKPRANNELSVTIDSGKTVCAMVFDANSNNSFTKNNLLSRVWLTADFNNKIQDAENYFSNKEASKALGALLITNKWERFNWQEILSNKFPEIKYPKDNYKSFIGNVYYKKKPLQNEAINLILFLPDSTKQLYQAKTDANGKILLDGLLFEGSAKMIFQQSNKKINTDLVKIEFASTEKFVTYQNPLPPTDYILSANKEKDLVSNTQVKENHAERVKNNASFSNKFHQLEEVSVYAKTKSLTEKLDKKLSSGRFFNPRETIYDFINIEQPGATGGNDPHTWLKSRIPGYDIGYEKKGIITYYIEETIVDKNNIFIIDNLPFDNIAMIKIQGKGEGHQVFIYLKKGGEMNSKSKSLSMENLTGYEHQEGYKSPDYTLAESSKIKTDNRDLLYWSNNISTDLSNQKYKLQFFNNDKAKQYRLVIINLSNEEGPVYFEKILE